MNLTISFSQHLYLWLLLLLPAILILSLIAVHHFLKFDKIFFEVRPSAKRLRYTLFIILAVSTYSSLCIALSKPQINGLKNKAVHENIQVAMGIDISKSMLAEDVSLDLKAAPAFSVSNRLNLARKFAMQLISRMHVEQAGIFFFAKNGVEMVPLTRDYSYINYILTYTDITELAIPGSDLVNALQTGASMLKPDKKMKKIMLIISDGEDTENDLFKLKKTIKSVGLTDISIFCLGTGKQVDTLIPIRRTGQIRGYYKNKQDEYLLTSLRPRALKAISSGKPGSYYPLTGENYKQLAQNIYNDILELSLTSQQGHPVEVAQKVALDLAPWFILAGLFLFTGYFLL